MKKIFQIILLVVIFGGGLYFGFRLFGPKDAEIIITRDALLVSLQSEGFLVSESALLYQQVEIDRSTGSAFKDFFWGQDIIADANVRVSSGVDLSKLSEEDIEITESEISIELPPVEVHSVEIVGGINLRNKQGILKKIFDNDDGYNEAFVQLIESGRSAAEEGRIKTEMFEDSAAVSAQKEIERLIKFVEREKTVTVSVKEDQK